MDEHFYSFDESNGHGFTRMLERGFLLVALRVEGIGLADGIRRHDVKNALPQ